MAAHEEEHADEISGHSGGRIAGLLLGKIWGHWFPINKKLWTSSYVLFAAGWSLLGLSICYWLIEIKEWKRGWTFPWIVFGSNAIAVYVFSELLPAFFRDVHVGGNQHAGTGHLCPRLRAHSGSGPWISGLVSLLSLRSALFPR